MNSVRPVIGTATYGVMPQHLERPPVAPPPAMIPAFNPAMMATRMMFPGIPPPPPPSLMVPAQVGNF